LYVILFLQKNFSYSATTIS